EAISVEYEVLPSVVDPLEATRPGAPAVWAEAPDNVVAVMSYGDAAAVEAAFAGAAHVVSLDVVSQRLVPSAMEPRSSIAEIDKKSGRLILHVQSQTPGSTRDVLAEAVLKRPKESVRVLVGDIGGGFGQKTNLYPEDGIVAYAALKLNRKVRWRGDRTEEFVGGTHGRDLTPTGELALDAKGRVQAYRVRSTGGTGAYRRPRADQLHRMDRRSGAYRKGKSSRHGGRSHRLAFRHHGDGAGFADHLHSNGLGIPWHRNGQDRHRSRRHRPGHRVRQRR